jgi:hypothetical protein
MRIISHHVLTALGFAAWAASAQTSGAPPTTPSSTQAPASAFEVASIKPAAPLNAGAAGLGAVHLGLHVEGSLVEIGRSLASISA